LPCVGAGQVALVRFRSHRRLRPGALARQVSEGAHRQDLGRHVDAARNPWPERSRCLVVPTPRTDGHLTRQAIADRMRRWGQQAPSVTDRKADASPSRPPGWNCSSRPGGGGGTDIGFLEFR
jgi:hypothetical protein